MLKFLKNQRISFYLSVAAVLLALVGAITFTVSNGMQGYGMPLGGLIAFLDFAAVLLIGFGAYASVRFGGVWWVTLVYFAALVLLCLSFGFTLANRVDVAAAIYTYDPNNSIAKSAFSSGVVSIAFCLISAVVLSVGAFFKQGSKN